MSRWSYGYGLSVRYGSVATQFVEAVFLDQNCAGKAMDQDMLLNDTNCYVKQRLRERERERAAVVLLLPLL